MISVYQEPIIIKNFITCEMCDYIINLSQKNLKPSVIGHDNRHDETVRKSYNTLFRDVNICKYIHKKCKDVLKSDSFVCEELHIVHYKTNGFYTPHFDHLGVEKHERMYTFVIYLNDNYEGGETDFPNLCKSYKLEKGSALFFHNFNTDNSVTKLSLHSGRKVLKGEKWIANLWVCIP